MTRLPYWAWRPWLTPWYAFTAWWYRERHIKIPPAHRKDRG